MQQGTEFGQFVEYTSLAHQLDFTTGILGIVGGCIVIVLGFLLFKLGVFRDAGDVEASFRDWKLLMRKSAPGSLFAIVGMVIVVASLFRPGTITSYNGGSPTMPFPLWTSKVVYLAPDTEALLEKALTEQPLNESEKRDAEKFVAAMKEAPSLLASDNPQ
jgi:hypothetical protein